MIFFLFFDIFFAIFQFFPRMVFLFFLFGYIIPYLLTCVFYAIISNRDPGFRQKKSGQDLLTVLSEYYDNLDNSNSSIQKIKNVSAKFCFECNILKKKSRHCEICNHCVDNFDHHCPYILNCIGDNNRKLFIIFLFITLVFITLRFMFSILSTFNVICHPHNTYYRAVNANSVSGIFNNLMNIILDSISYSNLKKSSCLYKYEVFGNFGIKIEHLYYNHNFFKVFIQIINWLHIILNLFVLVMVGLLTKISFCNYLDGVTTWEKHLRKHAQRDTSLDRELRQNFLDKKGAA